MTSDPSREPQVVAGAAPPAATPDRLYVWAWLPGSPDPVVAGALDRSDRRLAGEEVVTFTYARSYRERGESISLFPPELPLTRAGRTRQGLDGAAGTPQGPRTFDPSRPQDDVPHAEGALLWQTSRRRDPLPLHGCIRDAAPDAWGRRVINLRLLGNPDAEVSEMMYLAASSSDRIGALDFQTSATVYVPRRGAATLDQLAEAAALIEDGKELPEELAAAAGHGTSIGGARPKALLQDDGSDVRHLIAKFSSSTDTRPVVKAEAAAMVLAAKVGMRVAPVEVRSVLGKDVLLVERFDRPLAAPGSRRLMLSALTVLGYGELGSRHASYAELARLVRGGPFVDVAGTLQELYTRLVFNICVGNTDDHLRNHAFFWDGNHLELTPAYDLCPSPRTTGVATQAIGITDDGRRHSQLWMCRAVAPEFHLGRSAADAVIDHVVDTITGQWDQACDEAQLTSAERQTLWRREFLNPYVAYDDP